MSIKWNTSAQLKGNKLLMHTITLMSPKNHYYGKWKRPDVEDYILNDYIYMKYPGYRLMSTLG